MVQQTASNTKVWIDAATIKISMIEHKPSVPMVLTQQGKNEYKILSGH